MPNRKLTVISTTQIEKAYFAEYTTMVEAFGASLGVQFSARRSRVTVLALDLGTITGFATKTPAGNIVSGIQNFKQCISVITKGNCRSNYRATLSQSL